MSIGNILKSLRMERNLTQAQLANKLNIGQATIAGYENDTREPRLSCLIEYANFFECSIDFLVGREDDFGNILTPPTRIYLSAKSEELVEIFNALPPEHQKQILEYTRYYGAQNGINVSKK